MESILISRLLILCVLFSFPLVESDIRSPSPMIRNVGQDAFFMWNSTNGHRIFEASWGLLYDGLVKPQFIYVDRSNNVVLSTDLDKNALRYKGRVHWFGDINSGHVWFKLTNVTLNDTNQYVAGIVEEGKPNTIYSAQLTTAATPQFVKRPPLSKGIEEGQDLVIKCTAIGPPTPKITWVQRESQVSMSTGMGSAILRIANIRRYQNGTYECQARNNPNKRLVTAQTVVTVYFKPTVNESYSTSKSKSWNGNSIHLRCFATGLPSPRISWYKPTNQQITTGVIIVPGGSEVTVLTATDQADYGQYKCRATNILGSDEHVINVTKLISPGPVSLTITDVEASSINVTWYKPADDGGLDVTGYLVEVSTKPPVITVKTHDVITGLKANTLYAVKVYAKNIVGYGVESSKIIRTQKIGKPSAPELVIALLERSPEFKLSVLLRWEEPDDNGGNISRYTIYVKEVAKKAEWTKYDNVIDSKQLEYKITKDIVYGKTYMFMVTAWNKYGESVKDEGGAKRVNTTADKATATNAIKYCIEKGSKTCSTVLGVVIAILVLSIGFNLLQFVYLKRRVQLNSRKQSPTQKRKPRSKKVASEETYENDPELEDNPASLDKASRAQQPVQSGSEYETIHKLNPNKAASSYDASNYQGLNLMPNTSNQGTCGPVYESLGTGLVEPRVKDNDNEQHPYEPLNIRNQTSVYQSLQTKSSESAI